MIKSLLSFSSNKIEKEKQSAVVEINQQQIISLLDQFIQQHPTQHHHDTKEEEKSMSQSSSSSELGHEEQTLQIENFLMQLSTCYQLYGNLNPTD